MSTIVNSTIGKWKIVLIKTIDNTEPIYYRLANIETLETIDVPAYRILDEILNNKRNIVNIKSEYNQLIILDDNGYRSTEECIIVDEFDTEQYSIFDWSVSNREIGTELLSKFDTDRNNKTPSNISIESGEKFYWTCSKKHTLYCDFATYFSIGCKCPICEMKKMGKEPSLKYWCTLTNNEEILRKYESAVNNKLYSFDISYKSRAMVFMKDTDENEIKVQLSEVTKKA